MDIRHKEDTDCIIYSVNVRMMNMRWMSRGDKKFLDLVEILDKSKNKAIFQTEFVKSFLDQYWDNH